MTARLSDPLNPTLEEAAAIVIELVADFSDNTAYYFSASYQEAEVRKDFIDKLLIALGWDVNHEIQKNPFQQEVKVERTVQMATAQRRADYALALASTVEFRRALQQWWADGWDLLLSPTLAEPPVPVGTFANDPAAPMAPMARAAAYVPFTPAFNSSGQPAISLPLHWSEAGLPIGVQLVSAYAREDVLLRVAAQVEAASPWAHRHPPMSGSAI